MGLGLRWRDYWVGGQRREEVDGIWKRAKKWKEFSSQSEQQEEGWR